MACHTFSLLLVHNSDEGLLRLLLTFRLGLWLILFFLLRLMRLLFFRCPIRTDHIDTESVLLSDLLEHLQTLERTLTSCRGEDTLVAVFVGGDSNSTITESLCDSHNVFGMADGHIPHSLEHVYIFTHGNSSSKHLTNNNLFAGSINIIYTRRT